MNLKYPTKKKGDIAGVTLVVTNPLLSINQRRYFTAKCSLCQEERNYRYDSLKYLKGCPSRCQNKPSLKGLKKKYYTVLYPVKGRESFWKCKCFCGKEFNRKSTHIISGTKKGCGCIKEERVGRRKQLTLQSLLRNRYIKQARRAKRPFELSHERFIEIIKQRCHYCGTEPYQRFTSKGCFGELIYNGIDRKDNSKGYTIKNALPCCGRCNYAKGSGTYEEMMEWIEKLKNYEQKETAI